MNDDTSMTSVADRELLRRYADEASVSAFEELVRRHLDHVFSAALRRVNGDHALAKDVTQTVFVDFARKARGIAEDMPPGGWLHRHTGFVASKMIDKERRRRAREQEAATMNTIPLSTPDDPEWASTAPLLDAAMDSLPSSDRDAIVLRFFEQKDFRTVGAALGLSDDSAQKKVSRAVDKLRSLLGRRGVVSTGGALAALMVANSVQTAPAALAGQVSTQSLAGAATAGGSLGGALLGLTTAARIKAGAAVVTLTAVAGFAGSRLMQLADPDPRKVTSTARAIPPAEEMTPTAPVDAPVAPPAVVVEPMDLDALIAAAAAEWRGGRETVTATAAALGFVTQIKPAQIPQALKKAAALTDEPARILLRKFLVTHWAESQPRKAMSWVLSSASGAPRADLLQALQAGYDGSNPDAIKAVMRKTGSAIKPTPLNESMVGTIYRAYASEDPAKAIRGLEELENLNERGHALRGILDTVQTEADRKEIAALIDKIRRDDTRIQARRAMVEQWARRDMRAAAAFVETAEPAWERTRLMDSLGFTWLQSDPARAAAWWVKHAPGPDTLVKIINIWAQQDHNAAAVWLGKQEPGPSSDTARMTFSRQVADLDPESALLWAETVSDERMREDTINHIFNNWRLRDAGEANAFLSNSGWTADRVARLQTSPNNK